jgi:ribosomal-protein-alanine N-acetyltransferase
MRQSDLDAVTAVEERSLSPWSREQLAAELANHLGWQLVAEDLERCRLVGYICGRSLPPEAELFKLAVLPEYRRQGIGSRLLDEAEKLLQEKNVQQCHLELRQSNLAAARLYEKAGFGEAYRRKRYYADPQEDAVVMVKIWEREFDEKH